MNIFGVGGWELFLIAVIALVVAGPKRMAQWAYLLGQYSVKLRRMWDEVSASLQREMDEAGVDIEVPKTPTRDAFRQSIQKAGQKFVETTGNPTEELRQLRDEVVSAGQEARQSLTSATQPPPATPSRNGSQNNSTPENPSVGTWGGTE